MAGLNLHLYPSTLVNESRILRITRALADSGVFAQIEVAGATGPELPDLEAIDGNRSFRRFPRHSPLGRPTTVTKVLRTLDWSRRVRSHYRDASLACINAHSLAVLPLAAQLARNTGARLIYDTHELETEVKGSTGLRRLLSRAIERRLIHRCDAVVTVSGSIAAWYAKT